MFEQTFVQTGKTNTTKTVILSFAVQIAAIAVLVVLPLIYFQVLPSATLTSLITAPPPPPPPPPPPAAAPPKVVKVFRAKWTRANCSFPRSSPKRSSKSTKTKLRLAPVWAWLAAYPAAWPAAP